jgi:calcium-dependent protein kinase
VGSSEANFFQTVVEDNIKKKFSIVINPRMMASERKNPIEKNYEILEIIGKGGFGEVKRVKHKQLDIMRALKIIKKSKYTTAAELKMIKNEINNMKAVDHPNIVKLFEFFEDDENIYILTELCSGG